ncbi:MAG TPA: hypothetical protein VIC33_00485 [Vicinamibacterales bacterium]
MNTTFPTATGQTIFVSAGGNLQAAIDSAKPGDVVMLQAGATFTGNFLLKPKNGTGYVIIRTSTPDNQLPPPGTRITPDQADLLPKLVSTNSQPVLATVDGAHHYWMFGLDVEYGGPDEFDDNSPDSTQSYGLVQFGSTGNTAPGSIPHDLVIDRCYIHGNSANNVRRGVTLNSAASAVIDSYISDIHEIPHDAQAIAGWNGPGPFKIENNYLEAAGENVLFGGADPAIANLIPSDITITHNLIAKQPSWAGSRWIQLYLLQLENAQRVLIDGNVFEYGQGLAFTVNQFGAAAWSRVQDVTFTHNLVQHVGQYGVRFTGTDSYNPSQTKSKRLLIQDDLFVDVDANTPGDGAGSIFFVVNGPRDLTINHDTAVHAGGPLLADCGPGAGPGGCGTIPPSYGTTFTNNVMENGARGFGGYGNAGYTMSNFLPDIVMQADAFIGGLTADNYPSGNFLPPDDASVGFTDEANGNYSLTSSSPYHNAGTDGRDLGVDWSALQQAVAGVSGDTGGGTTGETGNGGDDTSGGTGGGGGTTGGTGGTTGGTGGSTSSQAVAWINLVQATATGGSLEKTAGCDGCDDAGGVSQQRIASGTGSFTFAAQPGSTTSLAFYVGLTHSTSTAPSDSAIDYGFSIWGNGGWEVREGGVYKTDGTYSAGDTFSVAIEAGPVVKYYHNGTLVYTSAKVPASYPYAGAGALYAIDSTVADAAMQTSSSSDASGGGGIPAGGSGGTTTGGGGSTTGGGTASGGSQPQPIVWTSLVQATPSGDSLQKTSGCDGCDDAGGVSQQQIGSGTGAFTFAAQPGSTTSLAFYAGLTHTTSTPPSDSSIDYGFSIWAGGGWEVREGGVYRTDGTYRPGDTFTVAIEAGPVVKYYHNGTLVYTSATAPASAPYLAAGSLYAIGSTISNATLQTP